MAKAYVGIGSNLEPETNIKKALKLLNGHFGRVESSSIYECAAQGYPQNIGAQDFLNLVVSFNTELPSSNLVNQLKLFEQQLGRIKGQGSYEPKLIDLDLLLLEPSDESAFVAHPDILTCAYVLLPLSQLYPNGLHPQTLQTYQHLWQELNTDKLNFTETLL